MGRSGVNLDCAIPGAFTIINIKCHLDISTLWVHIVKIAVPSKGNLMASSEQAAKGFHYCQGKKDAEKLQVLSLSGSACFHIMVWMHLLEHLYSEWMQLSLPVLSINRWLEIQEPCSTLKVNNRNICLTRCQP